MAFVGGKGCSGYVQWLCNMMPRHSVYVEPFLGTGVVACRKRGCDLSILSDVDGDCVANVKNVYAGSDAVFLQSEAVHLLETVTWSRFLCHEVLVYCDPPYLGSVRVDVGRRYYRNEMLSDKSHVRLLDCLRRLPVCVMVSGYESELYSSMLQGWYCEKKAFRTRGGMAVECVWMNFPRPGTARPDVFGKSFRLHSAIFAGVDYTERQRIKRKVQRWKKRLLTMRAGDRQALLEAITSMQACTDANVYAGRREQLEMTMSPASQLEMSLRSAQSEMSLRSAQSDLTIAAATCKRSAK